MVKVYGPMMSLDASGTLSDAVTFSKWKGRSYVRERTIPSNPQTGPQTGRRAMLSFLSKQWQTIPAVTQTTWQPVADELNASLFNAYLHINMRRWHNFKGPDIAWPITETGPDGTLAKTPTATWEENRIELSAQLITLGINWGISIYASTSPGLTTSVANCFMLQRMADTIAHTWYWTPPLRTTWYFNTRLFSTSAHFAAQGTEFDSGAP